MSKESPHHDLFAEPLYTTLLSTDGHRDRATYLDDFSQFVVRVCPYNLYGYILAVVFPLPHVRMPAPVECAAGVVIVNWDLEGSGK